MSGGVGEDVWPVSNGSNLKKHGFNTFGTSKEGLSAYIKKKKKRAAPFFLTKKPLKPKLNTMFPSTPQRTHSKINNGQTDLNEIL